MAYADFTAEEVGRPMSEEEKVYVHDWTCFCYHTINPLRYSSTCKQFALPECNI